MSGEVNHAQCHPSKTFFSMAITVKCVLKTKIRGALCLKTLEKAMCPHKSLLTSQIP